jgi:lipid-A-disaccharide synthase
MKYYIIAGEASGDLHGGNLIAAIKKADSAANIRCWGGDKMQAAGGTLVKHYRDLAFMGFIEVVRHLGTILNNIQFCKKDINEFNPDVVVFIDYPGFNLRVAKWARAEGYKTAYYISPQVWAWKESRVYQIKRDIDTMLVILPFEADFYKKYSMEVTYVGHPLLEEVGRKLSAPINTDLKQGKPVIALLPGSRAQEIRMKLPEMLKMVPKFPDYDFVIAMAPSQPESLYLELTRGTSVRMVAGSTYDLLRCASAALVTSGTATLETALFGVPQVVCYKGNALSFWIAKRLVKVKYISLVNLITDKATVTELIQDDLNEQNLQQALTSLLQDGPAKQQLQKDYAALWQLLGTGKASQMAATAICNLAHRNN